MSKTYDENVRKARMIADGIAKHLDELTAYGVNKDAIESLAASADDVAAKSTEVDELRKVVNEKAAIARAALLDLTDRMRDVKSVVKKNFDQSRWIDFGIEDKR